MRTHRCGELRLDHSGQTVRLGGWVHRRRDLGGLVFIDLRDRAGIVQVAFAPEQAAAHEVASRLSPESVVLVEGVVAPRPPGQANAEMATGEIEVRASSVRLVGPALTPAIPVALGRGEEPAAEELRLRYRHLDLRRAELQASLELRHRLMQRTRAVLSELGFLEIETPILTRPTPEGARDYLVPSRVHPGEFYALPQSPQLYKQLLMVAGFDRYFQIARCFRDEDLRADHQPEFTQIDLEASFVTAPDIYAVTEAVLVACWDEAGRRAAAPFPRMAYAEALEKYGTDKPDLRFGLEIRDVSALIGADSGEFLRQAIARGERVRAIVAPGGAALSRRDFDELTSAAKTMRATGLVWAKRGPDGLTGPGAKALGAAAATSLGLADGDAVVAVAGVDAVTGPALGRVRTELVRRLGLKPAVEDAFVWIEDFPMFEREPETGALVPMHHPFTAPHPDDISLLETDPERARSTHYDAVVNGVELGSGSIRIVDPALQQRVFDRLGIDAEDGRRRFGFLLEGLAAGAPPHGGIALGFDRIAMLLAGAESLRDVIAFPKTAQARALFEDAPAAVRQEDLDVLHLKVGE
ncbi:MAG TPA: aspartate--tRNA ligase [Gemmatimonadales bacterium]|nr:aspartate--tRNA ligase [Gemmatimonadales bacterium]